MVWLSWYLAVPMTWAAACWAACKTFELFRVCLLVAKMLRVKLAICMPVIKSTVVTGFCEWLCLGVKAQVP